MADAASEHSSISPLLPFKRDEGGVSGDLVEPNLRFIMVLVYETSQAVLHRLAMGQVSDPQLLLRTR